MTKEEVSDIAEYARIALSDSELAEMTTYLNDALELINPILKYDLEGVEPTFHPIGELENVVRPDVPVPGLALEEALGNAASTEGPLFRVPAILADGGAA